jgi:ABC-type sugar transport system substrate-binding protein
MRTPARHRRPLLAVAALASTIALAVAAIGASGSGASVTAGPYGATLPNGKYGENYNPKQSIVRYALGQAAALPTNATQKNIALAAMYRAGLKVDENLAFKCWQKNICDTGTGGDITVGLADGFGGNPARQLFKMEFILQALTYKQIGKIIYTDANLKTQKAISDVRSMIAQGVDVIVSYPDAGGALLPVYREATKRGIPVNLWSNANIGKPGTDYLNYSGTDICVLGKQFADVMNKSLKGGGQIALLGGTPGNTQSPAWQKCEKAALNKNIKVVATADTGWTRQGALQAMAGILAKYPDLKGVSYDYGDAFVGAIRAYQAANKPLNITATIYSNDNPLLCEYKKLNNPSFKVWTFVALFFQGRTALTAGMMKLAGAPVPSEVIYNPSLVQVKKTSCRADLPANGSPTALVSASLQKRMFGG